MEIFYLQHPDGRYARSFDVNATRELQRGGFVICAQEDYIAATGYTLEEATAPPVQPYRESDYAEQRYKIMNEMAAAYHDNWSAAERALAKMRKIAEHWRAVANGEV